MICYDPRTGTTKTEIHRRVFPNGVCMANDGVSFLFAESWIATINRYYFDGPKKGTIETVCANLPGYPDNINRASDGNYWAALLGMRTPALDLALSMPGFRRRMARRVAPDLWLYPNINTGCVVKFDEQGNILDALWDLGGQKPSDDHLDARAQGLSLSRRRLQQPDRPIQAARCRSALDRAGFSIGAPGSDGSPETPLWPISVASTRPAAPCR